MLSRKKQRRFKRPAAIAAAVVCRRNGQPSEAIPTGMNHVGSDPEGVPDL